MSAYPPNSVCLFLTLHHPSFSPLANVLACGMGAAILVSCFGFVLGSMARFECVDVVHIRFDRWVDGWTDRPTDRIDRPTDRTDLRLPALPYHPHPHLQRDIPDDCAFPVCVPGPNSLCTRVICKPMPIQALRVRFWSFLDCRSMDSIRLAIAACV